MNKDEIKLFYEFTRFGGKHYCLNTKEPYGFSKNFFFKNINKLIKFCELNKHKDCYINYNPLKEPINRKNINIYGINMICLDVEAVNKTIPENETFMSIMLTYIKELLELENLNKYMIVNSGNGYHVYIPIGSLIRLNDYNYEYAKEGYKLTIKELNEKLLKISSNSVCCDDRKDLAGILRIPQTKNTKANRIVHISEVKSTHSMKPNYRFRVKFLKTIRKAKKSIEYRKERAQIFTSDLNLETFYTKDIYNHIIAKMMLDTSLDEPSYSSWHSSIVFALQGLVYLSDLRNTRDVKDLQDDINQTWNCSISLSQGGEQMEDIVQPYIIAYKFAKENEYEYYEKQLKNILNNIKQ